MTYSISEQVLEPFVWPNKSSYWPWMWFSHLGNYAYAADTEIDTLAVISGDFNTSQLS